MRVLLIKLVPSLVILPHHAVRLPGDDERLRQSTVVTGGKDAASARGCILHLRDHLFRRQPALLPCLTPRTLPTHRAPARGSQPSPASPPAPPVASHPCPPATPPRGLGCRAFACSPFSVSILRSGVKLPAGIPSGYAWCRSVSSASACHRPTRTMSPPFYATATSTRQVTLPAAIPVFPSGGPAGHRGTGSTCGSPCCIRV